MTIAFINYVIPNIVAAADDKNWWGATGKKLPTRGGL